MEHVSGDTSDQQTFPWIPMRYIRGEDRPNDRPVLSWERELPTSTSLQLSDNNKDLVLSPRWMLYSKTDCPTGRLTVGRNITLTLTLRMESSRVEARSNTSTVALRVGDEKRSLESETIKYGHEYHETHSLTHSWSRALLEKPPIVQLLENFPAFYGTRRFITAFT
jgi:hypothetical protein